MVIEEIISPMANSAMKLLGLCRTNVGIILHRLVAPCGLGLEDSVKELALARVALEEAISLSPLTLYQESTFTI
jgi:hypothetical protein